MAKWGGRESFYRKKSKEQEVNSPELAWGLAAWIYHFWSSRAFTERYFKTTD